MKRRLLNLFTALSLLLFLGVVGLWVRSYWGTDLASYSQLFPTASPSTTQCREWNFLTARGKAVAEFRKYSFEPGEWTYEGGIHVESLQPAELHYFARRLPRRVLGFGYSSVPTPGERDVVLTFPLWLLALVLAAMPTVRAYRRLRAPRSPGSCSRCGYDLRASPDHCPECGAVASVSP